MNDSLKKLMIFISASLIIGVLILLISGGGDGEGDPENDSIAVREFKLKCDSLRLKKWNQASFKGLNSSLVAMESQEIFTLTEVVNIKVYLNLAYAQAIKDSCKSWLSSSGNVVDKQLFSEMSMLSGKSECTKMLSTEIQIMRAYFSAQQIPSKIRNFMQSEYTIGQYNNLIAEINSTAKKVEIKHFSSMITIASTGISQLNDFKNYANNFEGAYTYYENNADIDAEDILQQLCPDRYPKTNKYLYYLQKLAIIENLCNKKFNLDL